MYSMNYIGKFINNFREFYNEINTATLTGAIDVVVVEQPDGTFTCSPFHVRFGKLGVLRSRYKVVDIEINGEPLDIHMKLGESGEAFFVEELSPDDADDDVPPHLACSPIPTDTCFASGFPSPLPAPSDEWTRRRANSEVLKRRPKETLTTTFAADDPPERERTLDTQPISTEPLGFGSAPELPLVTSPSPPPLPRTFRAETVESAERKNPTSASSSEFRPIPDDDISAAPEPAEEQPVETTQTPGAAAAPAFPGSKQQQRRRRKRSLLKKKKEQQPQQSQNQNRKGNSHSQPSGEASDTSSSAAWESALSLRLPEQAPQEDPTQASSASPSEDDLSKMQNASKEADFHFFSDTEILPRCRPDEDSRPGTPVQSDTEFETTKRSGPGDGGVDESLAAQSQQSWRWGELPSPPRLVEASAVPSNTSSDEETAKQREEVAARKSILSDMFSFMKKTKRIRHNPESGGIYLSELNIEELEPEVAALYFPTSYHRQSNPPPECSTTLRDEDTESGNGPSLPQSPHSVEGAIGGPKFVDSDFEESKHTTFERKGFEEMAMSLCGGLSSPEGPSETNFRRHLVTFDEFIQNPKIVEDPNLVVRYDGEYYNWRTACPLVMSLVMFQQPLPKDVLKSLSLEYMPNRIAGSIGANQSKSESGAVRGYSSWFYWRRSSSTSNEPKKMVSEPTLQGETATASMSAPILEINSDLSEKGEAVVKNEQILNSPEEMKTVPELPQETSAGNLPKDTLREEGYNGSNSSDSDDARNDSNKSLSIKIPIERRSYFQAPEKFRKTLRLSSEQIAQLNLREGTNEAVFSVTTAYQGTTRCKCNIYRWRYDDKIVISDIDGTITKSDVLGHILPIVGKDWAQSGVAQLFTKIQNNGYRLLYLSARAIGQARVTREYLRSIKQDDLSLPDGPLLLNPTSLMSAFHREVIEKKPEEFKISCLRDIQALFPTHCKPFYAGYGNKINDVWSYRAVGIPIFRIFTINHRGELKHELTQTFQSSYVNMSSIVDQMFPPLIEEVSEDYSNFVFWRDPIADASSELNVVVPVTPPTPESSKTTEKK